MDWQRLGAACGLMVLLGACVVETRPAPPPPPPRYYYYAARRPVPPPPPPPLYAAPPPPERPAPPVLGRAPPPPPMPHPRFPARIVHPAPLEDSGVQFLDLQGLQAIVMRLRPDRKCGPRQLDGGHWIHLDCNVHAPVKSAKAFTPDKLNLLLQGLLNLDNPFLPGGGASTAPTPTPAPSPTPGTLKQKLATSLPDAVDHRKDGTEGPIKDQGQVGCCTAFSLSSAMDNAIRRQNSSDTASTMHVWSHYANPIVQDAGDRNLKKPIALWAAWPYDERVACQLDTSNDHDCGPYNPPVTQGSGAHDPALQAKVRDADSRGVWEIAEYDTIPHDLDTIAAFLATGADVWASMDIGTTWLHVQGDTIADWTALNVDGGHAFVIAGYRHVNGQRQFLVHNSWGSTWGDRGYAYVSEAMLKSFLKTAYKVVVTGKGAPAPVSTPGNALTDDDCGGDQLVDSVTGKCVKMCPDDSRPANGKCAKR